MTTYHVPELVAQFHLADRLARTNWSERKPVLVTPRLSLFLDGEVPFWYAWADPQIREGGGPVAVVGEQTYQMLSGHGPALGRAIGELSEAVGVVCLPCVGEYAEASRIYSEKASLGVVKASDAISWLEDRANHLLIARVDADLDDPLIRQTICREAMQISEDLEVLEARLERLRTVVDLVRESAVF